MTAKILARFTTSLLGLLVGALSNGLYLLMISHAASHVVELQSLISWSAFFWIGSVVSPIENFLFYQGVDKSSEYSNLKPYLFGLFVFFAAGIALVISARFPIYTLGWILATGCPSLITILERPRAILSGRIKRLAIANGLEGLCRLLVLIIMYRVFLRLDLWMVLFAYSVGSLAGATVLVARRMRLFFFTKSASTVNLRSLLGLSVTGGVVALSTGALPFMASGITKSSSVDLVALFTFSRLLLILLSSYTYSHPGKVIRFGKVRSTPELARVVLSALPICIFCLLLGMRLASYLGLLRTEFTSIPFAIVFSISLILNGIFSIYIYSQNQAGFSLATLFASFLSFFVAFCLFRFVDNFRLAFLLATVLPSLAGIFMFLAMDKIPLKFKTLI